MPAAKSSEIAGAIEAAIQESGYVGQLTSPVREQPRRFVVNDANGYRVLNVFAWTLTFGGRPSLPDEYRIQMTSVTSPLAERSDGPTVLVGWEPTHNLFAGFDFGRHRSFSPGSPSVQIDMKSLRIAETEGLSFYRKSNDEVAVGIRPDMFVTYATNAQALHRYGREAKLVPLLNSAVSGEEIVPETIAGLSSARRRVVCEVSRLSREAGFRHRVLFAYGNRCAVTRAQLRLVDAAHILPVGVRGSTDVVENGIALSPTYHRAFDAGLIFLNERYEMRLNPGRLQELEKLNLVGGLDQFRAPLGRIFLPPDQRQRPSTRLIQQANRVRKIQPDPDRR